MYSHINYVADIRLIDLEIVFAWNAKNISKLCRKNLGIFYEPLKRATVARYNADITIILSRVIKRTRIVIKSNHSIVSSGVDSIRSLSNVVRGLPSPFESNTTRILHRNRCE